MGIEENGVGFGASAKTKFLSKEIKVIINLASLKANSVIGAKTLARIPLNTKLKPEYKVGEWFKVHYQKEGIRISGFIHEMLVEIVH